MAGGNGFGAGGDRFKTAQQGLQRPVIQLGSVSPDIMRGADIRQGGNGNVAVAQPLAPQVTQVPIGKAAGEGVRGSSPIRVVGASDPFGMGSPQSPFQQPQPQPRYQAPVAPAAVPAPPQHAQLGANQEVHTLVALLQGPSGQKYEAIYEVVAQELGSKVLGVSERPTY